MGEMHSENLPATIVPFRRVERASRPPVALPAGEILFFTGVRYVRDAEDAATGPDDGPATDDGAQSSPGRRKRRRA